MTEKNLLKVTYQVYPGEQWNPEGGRVAEWLVHWI